MIFVFGGMSIKEVLVKMVLLKIGFILLGFISFQTFANCPKSFQTGPKVLIKRGKYRVEMDEMERVIHLMRASLNMVSLEALIPGTEIPFGSTMPSQIKTPEQMLVSENLVGKVQSVFENNFFSRAEMLILNGRLLSLEDPREMKDIADELGISFQAVSQRETRLVRKIRRLLAPIYRSYFGKEPPEEKPISKKEKRRNWRKDF